MDTCNSISLYKLNLSYEYTYPNNSLGYGSFITEFENAAGTEWRTVFLQLNLLFPIRPGLDLRIKCMEERATSESVFSVESIVD